MAQLDIRGQVFYPPGPWGTARPAPGVSLAIIDEDIGNSSDTIWTGSTNPQGQYAGTTRDWRDTRNVTVMTHLGLKTTQVADVADVMMLKAIASQRIGSRMHSLTLPFVPAPAGLSQPPILLRWGPPGLARATVDGVAVSTLGQFAQRVADGFGAGAAVGGGSGRREICIYGEEVSFLREVLATLEPELRRIEAMILPLRNQVVTQMTGAAGQVQASGARTAASGVGAGRAATSGRPTGPDLWAPVRQQVNALAGLLAEQLQRQASMRDGVNGGRLSAVSGAALRALAGVLVGVLQTGMGGAVLMAAVVAAVVSAAATVVVNLPQIVAAAGLALSSAGFGDAGAALAEAAIALDGFLDQTWVTSAFYVIHMVCFLVFLVATAPAAGWIWLIENTIGNNGLQGLRFSFSR